MGTHWDSAEKVDAVIPARTKYLKGHNSPFTFVWEVLWPRLPSNQGSEYLSLLSGEGWRDSHLLHCSSAPPPLPHLRLLLLTVRCIKRVDWGAHVLRGQSGLTLDQIRTLSCTYARGDKMFPKAWSFSALSLGFVSLRLSMPSHPSVYSPRWIHLEMHTISCAHFT